MAISTINSIFCVRNFKAEKWLLAINKTFATFASNIHTMTKNKIEWMAEEPVSLPDMDFEATERWLQKVAEDHNMEIGRLAYNFLNDEAMLKLNREFVNHDYYTDIITFDYSRHPRVSGEIYISLDTVRSNAEKFNVTYQRELMRVIAHGLLHLCGINDKEPGEREIMEQNEDRALSMLE